MLSISDLKGIAEEGARAKLLGVLLTYLGYEYGPQFVRDLWKRSKCKWDDFAVNSVEQFLDSNVSIRSHVFILNLFQYSICNQNNSMQIFRFVQSIEIAMGRKSKRNISLAQ